MEYIISGRNPKSPQDTLEIITTFLVISKQKAWIYCQDSIPLLNVILLQLQVICVSANANKLKRLTQYL